MNSALVTPGSSFFRIAALAIMIAPCCAADGLAGIPVTATSGSDARPFVIGWEFSVSSPVTVTGLAYLDPTGRGLVEGHQVGIFDTAGNLLVSATVPSGATVRYQNGFRIVATTYALRPGTYVVAGQRPSDADPAMVRATGVQTLPQITYLQERELQTDRFVLPSINLVDNETGDFGPSFTIAEDNGGGKAITGIVNSGSFQPAFASGTYVSIFGTKLSTTNRPWAAADFGGGFRLPTSLDGVTVTVNGSPAYVEYVSPGQINIVTPNLVSAPAGVPITVKYPGQPDVTAWVGIQNVAPSLFTWPTGTPDSGKYLVAQHPDFTNVGKLGLFPDLQARFTTPARPGETIILYGTGFGPTSPPLATGILADKAYPLSPFPSVTIAGVPAQVGYAGLVPSLSQVYQLNVTLPLTLADGDWPLIVNVNGTTSYPGLITVAK